MLSTKWRKLSNMKTKILQEYTFGNTHGRVEREPAKAGLLESVICPVEDGGDSAESFTITILAVRPMKTAH